MSSRARSRSLTCRLSAINRYIFQLRNGCGSPNCSTATCFTCRKRLAGKAPIRRYNPTSARTLAVYLASQDGPEAGLCPYLGSSSREAPPAVNSLIFSTRPSPSQHGARRPSDIQTTPRRKPSVGAASKPPLSPTTRSRSSSLDKQRLNNQSNETKNDEATTRPGPLPASNICVSEKAVPKDYRSFAVATFGTVAYKMLEWLTPQAIDAMTKKVTELSGAQHANEDTTAATADGTSGPGNNEQSSNPKTDDSHIHQAEPQPATQPKRNKTSRPSRTSSQDIVEPLPPAKDVPSKPKRNSKKTFRSSPTKSNNRRSMEPLAISAGTEETKANSRPPSLNGFYPEKLARAGKTSPAIVTRGVPEMPSKPAFFENVSAPTPTTTTNEIHDVESGSSDTETIEEKEMPSNTAPAVKKEHVNPQSKPRPVSPILEVELSSAKFLLPQSLTTLNVELVDFICDVFQEDRTNESQFFGPLESHASYPKPQNPSKKLIRRQSTSHATSASQWKAFNEQALFTVLSDPHSLVQSFSKDGKLYDSHTLFYCMLRMTRAAPSLVLHSLWMAAESLFTAPKSLQISQPRSGRALPRSRKPLTDFEAGCVMSVCLHALVAVAPFVADSKTLYDMSRIRSTGLVLGGNGISTRQPQSICLEYEDVFSNDIAVRLARRVFSAVSARRSLATLMRMDGRNKAGQLDILQPLLNQLDLLSSGPLRILEFTQAERLLHETRVPTLLLDWARTVLHQEWDGNPEIVNHGAFYGALSLISTMCKSNLL